MEFDLRAFFKKLWLDLRSGWWGLLLVWVVVSIAVYTLLWEFAEPLSIPDLINSTGELTRFLRPYGFFHIFFVILISLFTTLLLELVFRKLTWASYGIRYQVHTQSTGWNNPWIFDGGTAGDPKSGKRIEAIRMRLGRDFPPGMSVKYQAYVQDEGWRDWVSDGKEAGTTGLKKRLEAIKIKLDGAPPGYSIVYRVFVVGDGEASQWLSWVSDGEEAGTTGQSKRIEGTRILITGPRHYGQFWKRDGMAA